MDYELITNLTINENQGDEFRLLCPHCAIKTVHKVLVSAEIEWRYSNPDDWYISWDNYQIVQCQGCESPSFRKVNRNTEDEYYEEGSDIPKLVENEELYPSRVAGRQKTLETYLLPFDVT